MDSETFAKQAHKVHQYTELTSSIEMVAKKLNSVNNLRIRKCECGLRIRQGIDSGYDLGLFTPEQGMRLLELVESLLQEEMSRLKDRRDNL